MQKVLLDLWNLAQPILMVLSSLFALWILQKYGTRQDAETQRLLQEQIRKSAYDSVAYVYQRQVKDLKDPTKPGIFDDNAKRLALTTVVDLLRRMHGDKLSKLESHGIDIQRMLETMVESSVVELETKVTGTLAAPATSVRPSDSPAPRVVVAIGADKPSGEQKP